MPELARRATCSKQNIFDIESGKAKEAKMLLLYRLADALQVSPRWLATGKGTQRNTGPMSDAERDLVFLMRQLPDGARKYLLERAEALAVESAVKPSTTAPFGAASSHRK
jgi:transcriptional regulator with XRE-family HTH domain